MYHDEEEKELEEHGFRISDGGDEDEPLEIPEEIPEIDDDPEDRYH